MTVTVLWERQGTGLKNDQEAHTFLFFLTVFCLGKTPFGMHLVIPRSPGIWYSIYLKSTEGKDRAQLSRHWIEVLETVTEYGSIVTFSF